MKKTPRKHLLRIKVHSTTGGNENFVDLELSYQKDLQPRGIYLHVAPLEVKDSFIKYKAYTGIKIHLHPMARFSRKQFEAYEPDPDFVATALKRVMDNQNLKGGWPEEAA